ADRRKRGRSAALRSRGRLPGVLGTLFTYVRIRPAGGEEDLGKAGPRVASCRGAAFERRFVV
ncbi:MAG: hypothetical protein AB7W28_07230, partial [Armatimonadota bacterium]